jgi:hypothetical protein
VSVTPSRLLVLLLACLVAAGASACGGGERGLKGRASAYYELMVGRKPDLRYSSFLSPEYVKAFDKAALRQLDDSARVSKQANERYPACRPGDVLTNISDRFAYTRPEPDLGDAYKSMGSTRWVRVGQRWYLYMGSGAETKEYGPFPLEVSPPVLPFVEDTPQGEVSKPDAK